MRRSTPWTEVGRRLAVCAAIAPLIAGCGSGDGHADVSARTVDAVPQDLSISLVAAGDRAGWVAGVAGDQRPVWLWRLTPDGAVYQMAELPNLMSMDGEAVGDQLAVAGLRCIGEDPDAWAEECTASRAEVLLIDDSGEIADVTLFDDDTAIDSGDGLEIAGSTPDSVWVSTERGLFEVSVDGGVVREVSDTTGGHCVVDGSLYRILGPASRAEPTGGSSPPVEVVDATQQVGTRSVEVHRLGGDGFTPVPGGGHEVDDVGYFGLRCTRYGWEATGPDGALTDRWTPTDGWQATRREPAPAMAALSERSGVFALSADGKVLGRGPDGTFTALGIRLPILGEPGQMPASLTADRSPSMVVACTTRSTSQTNTETVCQAVAAPSA